MPTNVKSPEMIQMLIEQLTAGRRGRPSPQAIQKGMGPDNRFPSDERLMQLLMQGDAEYQGSDIVEGPTTRRVGPGSMNMDEVRMLRAMQKPRTGQTVDDQDYSPNGRIDRTLDIQNPRTVDVPAKSYPNRDYEAETREIYPYKSNKEFADYSGAKAQNDVRLGAGMDKQKMTSIRKDPDDMNYYQDRAARFAGNDLDTMEGKDIVAALGVTKAMAKKMMPELERLLNDYADDPDTARNNIAEYVAGSKKKKSKKAKKEKAAPSVSRMKRRK